MNAYSRNEQRVVDQLRLFLGEQAPAVYERCGRSLLKVTTVARESSHPAYRLWPRACNWRRRCWPSRCAARRCSIRRPR